MDNLSDISYTGLLSDHSDLEYLEQESRESRQINDAQQQEIKQDTESKSWSIN